MHGTEQARFRRRHCRAPREERGSESNDRSLSRAQTVTIITVRRGWGARSALHQSNL
jgi:hypothetical protein